MLCVLQLLCARGRYVPCRTQATCLCECVCNVRSQVVAALLVVGLLRAACAMQRHDIAYSVEEIRSETSRSAMCSSLL